MTASTEQPAIEGNRDSDVEVVIFEDLQCPDSAAFTRMLDERLLPKYAGRVAFLHRDFPLAKHTWAHPAAVEARYLEGLRPGLGLSFRRYATAHIQAAGAQSFGHHVEEFARRNEVEPARALAALSNPQLSALVDKDFEDGVAQGVTNTSTVFVNGKPFIERFSFEEISGAIEAALNR